MNSINLKTKIASPSEIEKLQGLSTEKLIIWIVGKSKELEIKMTPEEIVIECWLINPEKHSLRGYNEFPDSAVVQKRIGEMKGKKALLSGSEMSGYNLTEISKPIYADLIELIARNKINSKKGYTAADRSISSMEEAPYKRLKKTPAYEKFKSHLFEQIVETDFLYFYGLNWHSKKSIVHNRIKNVDKVVETFSLKDPILKQVHEFLNHRFANIRKQLMED
ncbi:MAG: hypothetical protein HY033_12560 [Ignavibacteriae bacterium]|nr:hypothetical protein [Ignavibacteria bacterium]MBI3365725.1 hypothetical protein [Ignavibacteriota bacterium]